MTSKTDFLPGTGAATPATGPHRRPDPQDRLAESSLYRLRRDTLMIVANLQRDRAAPDKDSIRRQMAFVQARLCIAALADPGIPPRLRHALAKFHEDSLQGRPGSTAIPGRSAAEPGRRDDRHPLSGSPLYRLRRDALMIVSNLNRGHPVADMETIGRQLVFVQSHLCAAALADPRLPGKLRTALVEFHDATVRDHIADRRGARRRRHQFPEA